MQQELHKLLEIIHFDQEQYPFFEAVNITQVQYNKSTSIYDITLSTPTILNVGAYSKFVKAMKDNYPCKNNIRFEIKDLSSITPLAINVYFTYLIETEMKGTGLYETLRKMKLSYENELIKFKAHSEILYDAINAKKNDIEAFFASIGCEFPFVIELEKVDLDEVERIIKDEKTRLETESMRALSSTPKIVMENKPNLSWQKKPAEKVTLATINPEDANIVFQARIFLIELYETKNGKKIYSIYVTDDTDSLVIKLMSGPKFTDEFLESLKEGMYIKATGDMPFDNYAHDYMFKARKIDIIQVDDAIYDDEPEKRVELHLHTKLSTMDATASIDQYVDQAIKWGHKAIAITDHGGIQAFPDAQQAVKGKDIKMIYGMEGYVVDDFFTPAYNPKPIDLESAIYTVLDLETTGLSKRHDSIIEFGAVKFQNGHEIDSFRTFINPKRKLPSKIVNITSIHDEDLINAPTIEEIMPKLKKFIGDTIIVAHNADFDFGFLNEALKRMGKDILSNPVIDTLDLAKLYFTNIRSYNLGAICRQCNILYDEEVAHRADYDAKVLGDMFDVLIHKVINELKVTKHSDLNNIVVPDLWKKARPFHVTMLVKNAAGLKALYNIVSSSCCDYFNEYPLIPRSLLVANRENLLIGSSCLNGEIFDIAQTDTKAALDEAVKFYDYIEIQPLPNYSYLIDTEKAENEDQIITILNDIVQAGESAGKIVVATGDCHYLHPRDHIFRDVYIFAKAKDAKRHPLHDYKGRVKTGPEQHFRTTREMLDGVAFLGTAKARELVITNTNKIADMIGTDVVPIQDQLFTPKIPGLDTQKYLDDLCWNKARELYGEPVPEIVGKRLEKELGKIRDNKFSVIYYLAERLVKHSNEDGYLVGSRGSVGSSLVATFSGITEVNPLPPHYLCPSCHHAEWFTNGEVKSGFDLADKICPICGNIMKGDGQEIPFETFLGIKGDKVPDIDLNFSSDYQSKAHEYTKVLCGPDNVFRAGTISTVAEKTAIGYARNYCEEMGKTEVRDAELRRLGHFCEGVKKTTGQHPAGIIVVPLYKEVHDFTPLQYPADEIGPWKTTHYPFSTIHEEILKLDILGHVDPYALRMLQDMTGINLADIPMNDDKVLSIFTSTNAIGVSEEQILNDNASGGIPEFGTTVVKRILHDAKPKKFSELVQVSGISHGTDVWTGNAQDLITSGRCTLMEAIGCRDDIMTYLYQNGLDHTAAFKIMESVRKGRGLTPEMQEDMRKHKIPDWYIDSCLKIKYMFPKAHAVAYVSMGLRIAWFKIYKPLYYYASFFSLRCDAYEIETMIKGYDAIKARYLEIKQKIKDRSELTTKEKNGLDDCLMIALEMTARGFHFENVSLSKSEIKKWVVDEENNSLIPAFTVIDGFGESAAQSVVDARNVKPFISKQDLISRTSVGSTLVKVLEDNNMLEDIQDEDQLSFDLFA